MEGDRAGNISDAGNQVGLTGRIRRYLPLVQGRRDFSIVEGNLDFM